jgi:flagellar protein FlgJ
MISQTDLSSKAAYDIKGMNELSQSAKANDPAALKAAATQFEGLFINMMLKSMRDATPQDGIMDSEQSKMFTTMLDQQTSADMAKKGTGLADVLIRQLSNNSQTLALGGNGGANGLNGNGNGNGADPSTSALSDALLAVKARTNANAAAAIAAPGAASKAGALRGTAAGDPAASSAPHIRAFREKLGAHAEAASAATGIPAKFMLGQAALESGWGKREIKNADGTPSHNLFGIKAGSSWTGKTVDAVTTEYVNGVPQTRVEKFRAYDSYADSFKDYANLITGNKRYEKVLTGANAGDASSFAQGLQKAGYATDPNYATKLARIIQRSLVG